MSTEKWWKAESEEELKTQLWASYSATATSQADRHTRYKRALRLYSGRDALPGQTHRYLRTSYGGDALINLNVIASILRTLRAKITKSPAAPWPITTAGSHTQQTTARKLQRFLNGAIAEMHLHDLLEKCFDFWGVCGDGLIKIASDGERPTAECLYPWEVFWSETDGYYGKPRTYYQRAYIDRDYLAEIYPDHADAIQLAAKSDGDQDFGLYDKEADVVEVCEAWHLPVTEKSEDGRHVIAIQICVLLDEPWKRTRPPFAHFMGEKELVGSHGSGIVDELEAGQQAINATLDKIMEGQSGGGHVVICCEAGAKVDRDKITDELFSIVEYTGTPPVPVTIPTVSAEVYNWLWKLVESMHSIYGTSQLSAASQVPAGVTSGRGMRVLRAVETERYSYLVRRFDRLLLDCCDLIIDAASDLAEAGSKYAVKSRNGKAIDKLDWKSVKMDRADYVLDIQPQNYLAQSGAGRVEGVQELLGLPGAIDPRMVPSLLALPDLDARPDPYTASAELARAQIERIIDHGEPQQPSDYQDLATAMQIAADALCRAETYDDVDDERKGLLRDYIDGAKSRMPAPQAQPTQPTGEPQQ